MSPWAQVGISLMLLAGGAVGFAAVSPDMRAWVGAQGIDLSVLARTTDVPGATGAPPGRQQGAVGVVVAEVTQDRTATRLKTIGTGRALRSVALFARSTGVVEEMGFTAGEWVQKDHILAALDRDEEEIATDRAEIALAEAKATFERVSALANRNAVSQVSEDDARRAVERAELDLRTARLALERRLVRAPFAGVLGISEVEIGDLIGSDTEIGIIDDRSRLEIDLYAPERFASLIRIGQTLSATTAARPGEVFAGEIVAIDNRVDPESRTLRMRGIIENVGDVLRPGFGFSVEMDFSGESQVSVPALAVQWQASGPFVWQVVDGKAMPVPVKILERNDTRVLVEAALKPGDQVVSEGVQKLRPGIAVAAVIPAESDT